MLSSVGDKQINWMLRRCAVYGRKQAGKLSADEMQKKEKGKQDAEEKC